MEQLQEVIYEELPETDIPLSDNQAYGHVNAKRRKMEQIHVHGAIYEEPLETDIPLRDNQAYGHVDIHVATEEKGDL